MSEPEKACASKLILEVLKTGKVQTFFQPLVSIQKKNITGFESFARGLADGGETVVKPRDLFNSCQDAETMLAVDRACRNASLQQFKSIYEAHKNVLLFLNVNVEAMKADGVQMDHLLKKTQEFGYAPHHVVIEIESSKINEELPRELFDFYRESGFKYCIDDIGRGDLGMDKLFLVKPDFIKISRTLFSDMEKTPHKSDMLKSLCKVASDLGCIAVGKSVEAEEEAFTLLEHGITHQQGFFYTKTKNDPDQRDPLAVFREKVASVHERYREHTSRSIRSKKEMFQAYNKLTQKIVYRLEATAPQQFQSICQRLSQSVPQIAGLYVLNEHGMQVTSRFIKVDGSKGPAVRELEQREDHSIKDYVLYLHMGFDKFVTQPFRSTHSNKLHTLISRKFYTNEGEANIACVEFPCQPT